VAFPPVEAHLCSGRPDLSDIGASPRTMDRTRTHAGVVSTPDRKPPSDWLK
jgi:hypothetical protein